MLKNLIEIFQLGFWLTELANYPGVANKVVNVNKVTPIKRRAGICLYTS